MWKERRVAVVLPTYNEKDSIRQVVFDFAKLESVDLIIVVNNNATPGTSEELVGTPAIEVHESQQGYGAAIQRGVREALGRGADLVSICEPDGTFVPADIMKLLAYCDDIDVVFGSRTVSTFIWDGANMGPFLRWGNWFVAKLIEALFNTVYLSDVGCTFRVLSAKASGDIAAQATSFGSAYGLEMMLAVIAQDLPFVQVPVNYRPRVGESSVTGSMVAATKLGLQMIGMVLRERFVPRRAASLRARRAVR